MFASLFISFVKYNCTSQPSSCTVQFGKYVLLKVSCVGIFWNLCVAPTLRTASNDFCPFSAYLFISYIRAVENFSWEVLHIYLNSHLLLAMERKKKEKIGRAHV